MQMRVRTRGRTGRGGTRRGEDAELEATHGEKRGKKGGRTTLVEGRGNESEWDGEELKRVDILSATYRSSDIVAPATFFHDSTSATAVVFFCRCIF